MDEILSGVAEATIMTIIREGPVEGSGKIECIIIIITIEVGAVIRTYQGLVCHLLQFLVLVMMILITTADAVGRSDV